MTGRRVARALAGVAAMVLAVGAAVLAEEVRRWPERIEAGDAAFAAAPARARAWSRPERRSARLAGDLLAVEDDLAFRRALQLIAHGRVERFVLASSWVRLLAEAETVLAALEEDARDPRRRAAAANLLGIVYFDGAQASTTRRSDFLRASIAGWTRASRLDPLSPHAKYNLELLLTRLEEDRTRAGRRRGSLGGGPLGGDDAGLRLPGEGY
ncbi:MAG: hypothetical protein ICV64_01220 [Thermoleophilia bacterium]|nr:hypothetical protein [Thermoleophilia bacterium]